MFSSVFDAMYSCVLRTTSKTPYAYAEYARIFQTMHNQPIRGFSDSDGPAVIVVEVINLRIFEPFSLSDVSIGDCCLGAVEIDDYVVECRCYATHQID